MEKGADFNRIADELIREQRWSEAKEILTRALQEMPADWKPIQASKDLVNITFWDSRLRSWSEPALARKALSPISKYQPGEAAI